MHILIMGCGRAGSIAAETMVNQGHFVTVMDVNEEMFSNLSPSARITPLVGDGTLDEDLKRAGVESADVFVAMENSDTRNAFAAQKARHIFNIPKVICHMEDPLLQQMYNDLGLLVVSSTEVVSGMILEAIHR